jgi:hypothetical protein
MACEDLISVAVYRVLHVRPPVSIFTVIITFTVNAAAIQTITDAFFLFYHCGSTTRRLQARHAEDRDCRSSLLATQRRAVAARLRSFRLIAVREKVKVTPFLLCNISLRLYLIHVALVFR